MKRSKPPPFRFFTALLVLLAAGTWLYLAPTSVGGSMNYVTTHGDSMAPRFHTGDLALIRAVDHYRVGEIVAYRSSVLGTVVLHRIIARDGDSYVIKGDNNDFIDPTRPGRDEMIGRLWLHLPRGGVVLGWLRTPAVVALLAGGVALLWLLDSRRRRRRRDSRRSGATQPFQGNRPVIQPVRHVVRRINAQQLLTASAVAAAAFLLLGFLAFTRPTTKPVSAKSPYTEQVKFSYRADASAGPVYPGGVVKTGDPVFLRLVDDLVLTVDYRFAAAAPHQVSGKLDVLVRLSSPTGWARDIALASPTRFEGDNARQEVTLQLARIRSLIEQVEKLTGAPAGEYAVAVIPRTHVAGTVDGQPIDSEFAPALRFQLNAVQLRASSDGSATSENSEEGGFAPSRRGAVEATSVSASNRLTIVGHGFPVATLRWVALAGLLLAVGALLAALRQPRRSSDPCDHIRARYGHLIVPIAGITHNPARPPIDVTSIDALVQLADRSERLILHHRRDDGDVYLVDDEGTIYRYETRPSGHRPASPRERGAAAISHQPHPVRNDPRDNS